MALAVFGYPTRYERTFRKEQPAVIASFAGSAAEQRARLTSRPLRVWQRSLIVDEQTRRDIEAFFDARYQIIESFLWQDPDEPARYGVSPTPANPDGSTTAFVLPAGEYPANDGRARLYRNGVIVALSSVDTDNRTLNASSAPLGGVVPMTADYAVLRRVKLAQPIEWSWIEDYWQGEFSFVEVVA